jgi:hypothetical protein
MERTINGVKCVFEDEEKVGVACVGFFATLADSTSDEEADTNETDDKGDD